MKNQLESYLKDKKKKYGKYLLGAWVCWQITKGVLVYDYLEEAFVDKMKATYNKLDNEIRKGFNFHRYFEH